MKQETLKWKSKDGLDIFGRVWKTDLPQKSVIALVHGFGEHSGRYEHVAEMFCSNGYSVIALDHRGHGKSTGQRGHTPNYGLIMDDLDIFIEKAKDVFPAAKIIIYGHSMGGAFVTNYLIRKQPQLLGAIVTSPLYRTTEPPPAFQVMLGKVMQNLWGGYPDKAKVPPEYISRDQTVVDKYINDPLVHNKISAKMGMSMIETGEYAIANGNKISISTLLLHGEDDKITDCHASKEFHSKASDKVQIITFPGMYHELHNEPEKEEVFAKIITYCDGLIA